MPLFEFICLDCDWRFEALVLDADEEISCFSCNSDKIEKLFSPFGIKSDGEFTSSASEQHGCGCSPVSCGCSVKN